MGHVNRTGLVEWVGAIHIHSTYSDGRGSVETIVQAASSLGLDYCILSDHDDLSALPAQGYANGTLVLVGTEVTCSDNSHCLALDIRRPIPAGLSPQETIDTIRSAGGLSILAHPFDRGSPRFNTYYPWKEWTVTGYTALEMWNFLVNWGEGVTNMTQAAVGYVAPLLRLTGPNPEGLAHWDRLNHERFQHGLPPVPIVGGVDAHGYFSYRRSLATIRTHLWAPPKRLETAADQNAVMRAIRTGRSFLANDALHDSRGFTYEVIGRDARYPETGTLIQGPAQISITLPRRGSIRVLCDGEPVHTTVGTRATLSATRSGTYRCEVSLSYMGRPRPWIFSNAVHIRTP